VFKNRTFVQIKTDQKYLLITFRQQWTTFYFRS